MTHSTSTLQSMSGLSRADFKRLGEFIHEKLGIKMPEHKKNMLESRLRRRLNRLNMDSYSQYTEYFFSREGFKDELPHFIDVITTNKTDFFREPNHFKYLTKKALPELMAAKTGGVKQINVWSSACSRGDEPYSLAMVLDDFLRKRGFDYTVIATDISSKVLNIAVKGVYDHGTIEPVPFDLRKKYLLRSKDKKKNLVRIVPDLRAKVNFRQLNLMSDFRFPKKFDVVFCRNVIIYFDKSTTHDLMLRICRQIKTGGFLFMGHSEVLEISSLPIVPVVSTVYQKQ